MSLTTRLLAPFRSGATSDRGFALARAEPGRALVVVQLGGGAADARRLRDIGLAEGRGLSVVQQRDEGGVLVAAGDGRLALDAATAARVRVRAADAAPAAKRLWDLQPGQRALVRGLREGAPAYRAKLLAMGLLPGTVVEVVRMAPLGDPVELRVRGYQLSLRRAEAEVLELDEVTA
ncbi:MAG: ferrous iron transport protein A [Alphaproteobacteria bacterium]|jgi:ferrous iron transport protein A|nr:ferrous iron transport protein A [Alphaproteobacteria bacterium]